MSGYYLWPSGEILTLKAIQEREYQERLVNQQRSDYYHNYLCHTRDEVAHRCYILFTEIMQLYTQANYHAHDPLYKMYQGNCIELKQPNLNNYLCVGVNRSKWGFAFEFKLERDEEWFNITFDGLSRWFKDPINPTDPEYVLFKLEYPNGYSLIEMIYAVCLQGGYEKRGADNVFTHQLPSVRYSADRFGIRRESELKYHRRFEK